MPTEPRRSTVIVKIRGFNNVRVNKRFGLYWNDVANWRLGRVECFRAKDQRSMRGYNPD